MYFISNGIYNDIINIDSKWYTYDYNDEVVIIGLLLLLMLLILLFMLLLLFMLILLLFIFILLLLMYLNYVAIVNCVIDNINIFYIIFS